MEEAARCWEEAAQSAWSGMDGMVRSGGAADGAEGRMEMVGVEVEAEEEP